jgi:serine/threonine protein kinase
LPYARVPATIISVARHVIGHLQKGTPAVRFQCSHCHGILAIDDGKPGEAVACGHCGTAVAIPATRLSPGAVLADFIIRERLGAGGMGTVYLAHQISLDRAAALKILHERYASDEAYIKDFVREARAAAAINHPNIVQAYAVGEEEGLFYFAMEYVQGSTLKQVLSRGGRLVADRALTLVLQIAGALDFAWRSQGLMHRDIKPDNIILTDDGGVKLADLGLARKLTDTASDGTQELYGTPQYIAPEHLLGSPGDNRSDIYSLGATLYHALSGRFPYEGVSAADIAQKHLSEPLPALHTVCPDVPPALAQVVEVMLSKRPEQRYPDAATLLVDLEAVRHGSEPVYVPDPASQVPIAVDSDEAATISVGASRPAAPRAAVAAGQTGVSTGKRRFSVSKTASAPRQAAVGAAVAADLALGEPGADAAAGGAGQTAERGRRSGRTWTIVAVLVVLVLAVGGGLVLYLRRGGQPPAVPHQAGSPQTAAGSPTTPVASGSGAAAVVNALRDDIAKGAPEEDIRARLAAAVTEFGYDGAEGEALASLAAPYIEKDLEKARQPVYAAERAQWEKAGAAAKARAAAKAEEAQQAAAAAAAQQAKDEEAKRLAEQKAEREAASARQKSEARAAAVELCRKHQFDEANVLFVPLTTSRDEELARWAGTRQKILAMAKQLFESIVNSKEKLAGLQLPIPAQPKVDWRVSRIGFKDVELQVRRVTYVKGERREEMETLEIPFAELSPVQLDKLTEKKWELDGGDEAERKLWFGAYLVAREQFTGEARKRLEACGRDDAGPVLAELAAIEPELRKAEVERVVEQIRQYAQQGDKRRAQAAVEYLQRQFPTEAEQMKEELRGLVGGP